MVGWSNFEEKQNIVTIDEGDGGGGVGGGGEGGP